MELLWTLFVFASHGGLFAVAAGSAWVGYRQRARRPGFNRWYLGAAVAAALGIAAVYVGQQLSLAMRGAITG
ncbi:hypothetical protein IEQ11_21665 [Lysobacter capsici]|jgi:hypothetical protein|uniref:hypothetical protein n=1 Tax=Lysobacter capsici TaxID=435897 RepID=UPI001784395A|nr:hypothetical protein [Lysobacter capsici]UOF14302.1 hypothetical protein IEQ11_21665 [Lysobacter capsici]